MFAILLALVLNVTVNGYEWIRMHNLTRMPRNVVVHRSTEEGLQGVCRSPGWASGRMKSLSQCILPSGSKEHTICPPFEILIVNQLTEKMFWRVFVSAEDTIRNGVRVKLPHKPEPHMYVCASPKCGPGKLVIWAENDIICYVSHKGKEHRLRDNFMVLKPTYTQQYELRKIKYYLDRIKIIDNVPQALAQATLRNRDSNKHLMAYTLSYKITNKRSWSNSIGYKIGTEVSVSAGIPEFAKLKWKTSTKAHMKYKTGEKFTETITNKQSVEIDVPANHSCKVQVMARKLVIKVPYQALATSHFPDGTSHSKMITGVYDGIDFSDDATDILRCFPIDI